jgi:NADH:ubiquinone oxidoreductase subunit E
VKPKQTLYLCMGSACHQLGGFRLIPIMQSLIARHNLEDCLEVKGAFCLEMCEHGRSLKFDGSVITGLTADNITERFEAEILPRCQGI